MEEQKKHPRAGEPAGEDEDIGAPEESPAADTLPGLPAEDDSALGDTDQHSDA